MAERARIEVRQECLDVLRSDEELNITCVPLHPEQHCGPRLKYSFSGECDGSVPSYPLQSHVALQETGFKSFDEYIVPSFSRQKKQKQKKIDKEQILFSVATHHDDIELKSLES